ncbi:transcriptional regulator [Zafaria cholistanensis]|uniref:Transcriptional regulator n=1 Tax=Zafaria cholistanensis TaxID=1682741 RepID=A0A5A7NU87_9MICC|nr:TetR/AcrR family transcriptional regulator [Zafaria cholistanensis]GER24435.1 transcriptional regulator [Zafaria cholistanensis]
MPKIVDHDRRRLEVVEAACEIIARQGLDRTTLRDVAAEAGFSNGALKPYFPTKADLMQSTFTYVFQRTNDRVTSAVAHLSGMAALRAFAREVLPLDGVRLDEARVVVFFWQAAMHNAEHAAINDAAMLEWRRSIRGWLDEACAAGELSSAFPVNTIAETLLNFLLGAQISAVLDGNANTPLHLEDQLDAHLRLVSAWN